MKSIKTAEIISSLLQKMIIKDKEEWPPGCWSLTFQPIRPKKGTSDN